MSLQTAAAKRQAQFGKSFLLWHDPKIYFHFKSLLKNVIFRNYLAGHLKIHKPVQLECTTITN